LRVDIATLGVIQAPEPEPRIMRYEFSEFEWGRHQADAAEQAARRSASETT
jgi:hypothetical protein